ncbi:uncharacterized protein K02A2.6-like [Strongylocentrotus purpuratus]|uniref:Reverse transcriptase n=1 Tax=Strongylocentrotus purpuratus TaxID=7668 RepID=A0A7M7PFF0_STRPU|nr:uncharacterized protein K02A2.6-like [Strongylocentrotus purpuratus]|eukprot:XP_011680858.1 PREDICTED: uncharacterized protein K02A2.6-like [Strongylocentrotus purpuratus]
MASTTGRAESYNPDIEQYESYRERMDYYFVANDISDERKKVAVILSVMGAKEYRLLKSVVAPQKVSELTLKEVDEALKEHYNPKPPVMLERYKFYQRNQRADENIATYYAELKKMAETCDFSTFRKEALRDRFVCGLAEESVQRRLLSEDDITIEKAVKLATSMEAASKGTAALKTLEQKSSTSTTVNYGEIECYCCGKKGHTKKQCRYRELSCDNCHRKGHLKQVCKNSKKGSSRSQNNPKSTGSTSKWKGQEHKYKTRRKSRLGVSHVEGDQSESGSVECSESNTDDDDNVYYIGVHKVGKGVKPIMVDVEIEDTTLSMELDTGCGVSIVSQSVYEKNFKQKVKVDKCDIKLKTFTRQTIPVMGKCMVNVNYHGKKERLPLIIVKNEGPTLLGRDWLWEIPLRWKEIFEVHHVTPSGTPQDRIEKAIADSEVFDSSVGRIKGVQAKLKVKSDAEPRFFKPRPIPFAIKDKVAEEIDRLVKEGVLEPVEFSDWAAPVVPVQKPDGKIRLCGDYKITVNPQLEVKEYPMPRPEELFASLQGGKKFTKLDLKNAYQQVDLEEKSRQYVTINTHLGLYRYTRLPFGVSSAPAIFQECMDKILHGLKGVGCYLDDIIVTGSSDEEHASNLESVLKRLSQFGLRLKRSKCAFMQDSVEYLGHVVDAGGLHPSPSRVEAIASASPPKDASEVQSFTGLINYYRKFIPNLASILKPIDGLKKKQVFEWTSECQKAFDLVKKILSSSKVLVYFDPSKEVTLAVDASPYGIGAVISHVTEEGDKPIAYASRKLTKAEMNYSQLEKEALAIVYGVRYFHQYLCGRKFMLLTDHKPLTFLLGPKKGIPVLAASRLQRWAILLSGYVYDIKYRTSQQNANADFLSRLPGSGKVESEEDEFVVKWTEEATQMNETQLKSLPVTADRVRRATDTDRVLPKVRFFVQNGWPCRDEISPELQVWLRKKDEMTVESGCLLWGIRVIIPDGLQQHILEELHRGHQGMVRMKSLARMHVYWPGLDQDIERLVQACSSCQAMQTLPPAAPVNPWAWPSQPWHRVHVDFAGPFLDQMFLLVVDAHSKWPEVIPMRSTTAANTIRVLRCLFSRYGLPHEVVSDNGPQFVAEEFAVFLKKNGIKHIKSAVKHPASNGEVERFVQTFKKAMKKAKPDGGDVQLKLARFLLSYRTTPHVVTQETPSKMFMGRDLRTRLSQVRPDLGLKLQQKRAPKKERVRSFEVGERVRVLDFRIHSERWSEGMVTRVLGPVTYQVVVDGIRWKRHVDQIRRMSQCVDSMAEPLRQTVPNTDIYNDRDTITRALTDEDIPNTHTSQSPKKIPQTQDKSHTEQQQHTEQNLRRSKRHISKPDRLDL